MLWVVTASISAQVDSNPQQMRDSKPTSAFQTKLLADETNAIPSAPDPQPPPRHVFGTIQDLENTNDTAAKPGPLTVREKFIFSMHQSFDVSAHLVNLFQTTGQQALDSQPHYGQGWDAYGKRFVASEVDQITGSVLIDGMLPSILHQDPRYFRQGEGSFASRAWYAINRTVVTRTDGGAAAFNTSETLGQFISCGISLSYYPQQDRSVTRLLSNWGVNLAGNSGYNILSEYYPDMKRIVFHRHKKAAVANGN
jgi:hypothetical protein